MSRHVLSCVVLNRVVFVSRYAVLCCIVLNCVALRCAVLCCAVLCCAVLCCTMLCCTVLCCVMPCHAMCSFLLIQEHIFSTGCEKPKIAFQIEQLLGKTNVPKLFH